MNQLNVFFIALLLSLPRLSFGQVDIFDASRTGDISVIQQLVKLNPDTVNAINPRGDAPLLLAAYRKQPQAVTMLINYEADLNQVGPDGSALHAAVHQGSLEITRILAEAGAELNIMDGKGETPLMMAVRMGNLDLVTYLTRKGADIHVKDKQGKSALDYAIKSKEQTLVFLLKSN